MSKKLDSINVSAWKMQFYSLFSRGKEMVEKSINTRFFNDNPSKNYSPELKQLFLNTLGEFIEKDPSCNLQAILDEHSSILGEEANHSDLIS